MEDQKPTGDVIPEEPVATSETTETATVQPAESTESVTTPEQETQPVEQKDDFWKNRSYELERKLGNLTNDLPKIIEETLVKNQQPKQEEKYTVAQLEAYAQEHPEHRPWVEEQKLKILEQNISTKFEEKRVQDRNEMVRQQTFSSVLNDPKYSDAFVLNQFGQKQLNPSSPMGIAMDTYLRDPDVARRPDAWVVAAKLARADVLDMQLGTQGQKLTSLKRQNAQLKQKTLVEGSGVQSVKPTRDAYTDAKMKLAQTGKREDAQAAVAAYLEKIRK